MFEDIIGEIEKKKEDIDTDIVLHLGNGITTCPNCGSDNITKGNIIYLLQQGTSQRCECNSCNSTWSLAYNTNNTQYKFELHPKTTI